MTVHFMKQAHLLSKISLLAVVVFVFLSGCSSESDYMIEDGKHFQVPDGNVTYNG